MGQGSGRARVALGLIGLALACQRLPPAVAPLAVDFAGCSLVRRGPICALGGSRTLRLWVPGPENMRIVVTVDGHAVPSSARAGAAFEVVVPARGRVLQVRAELGAAVRGWSLAFEEATPDPRLAGAEALRLEGKTEEARRALERDLPSMTGETRDRAQAILARLALTRGDLNEAAEGLRRCASRAMASGRVSDAVRDLGALLYLQLRDNQDPAAARLSLAQARSLVAEYPEGRGLVRYYEGLAAVRANDVRRALAAFHETIELSRRLANNEQRHGAEQALADLLTSLGRTEEALELLRALVAESTADTACNRAGNLVGLSWLVLLNQPPPGVRAGSRAAEDPGPVLERAGRALADCPDPYLRRHALINEARFALERGDLPAVRTRLLALGALAGGRGGTLAVWEKEIEARLALVQGQPRDALRLFQEQALLARADGFGEGQIHAAVGKGRALLALRRIKEALLAFQAADTLLEELLDRVPLAEGRNEFVGLHDEAVRQLVSTLVDLGRTRDAYRTARLARARVLRRAAVAEVLFDLPPAGRIRFEQAIARYQAARASLESAAEHDWERPASELPRILVERADQQQKLRAALDEAFSSSSRASVRPHTDLREPLDGEVQLLYFPGARGWLGFAATPGALTVRRLSPIELGAGSASLARALLAPFDAEIAGARRVLMLPTGPVQTVDLHALPWRGAPLIDLRVVAYGLDLSRSPAEPAAMGGALIVSNPTGDLLDAGTESDQVAKALSHFKVERLVGAEATRERLMASLPEARIFHFAGHAGYAGVGGFDSALMVGGGGRLSVGDVLTLPRAPSLVVLAACEAARAMTSSGAEGLGLAQAFLAAGAKTVVAPGRVIPDRDAGRLFAAFYQEYLGAAQFDPAEALSRVQRNLHGASPALDWSALRVLQP
jgi:tetratricopeptide (TPR) repeat protein